MSDLPRQRRRRLDPGFSAALRPRQPGPHHAGHRCHRRGGSSAVRRDGPGPTADRPVLVVGLWSAARRLRRLVHQPRRDRSADQRPAARHPVAGARRDDRRAADRDPAGHDQRAAARQAVRLPALGTLPGRRRGAGIPGRDPVGRGVRGRAGLAARQRLHGARRRSGAVPQADDPALGRARARPGRRAHPLRALGGARRDGTGLPAHRTLQGPHPVAGPAASRLAQRGDPGAHGARGATW